MNEPQKTYDSLPPLLKGKEVAELLNISRSQAYNLMRTGAIPTIRFGRCVRVRRSDLESFIRENIHRNILR